VQREREISWKIKRLLKTWKYYKLDYIAWRNWQFVSWYSAWKCREKFKMRTNSKICKKKWIKWKSYKIRAWTRAWRFREKSEFLKIKNQNAEIIVQLFFQCLISKKHTPFGNHRWRHRRRFEWSAALPDFDIICACAFVFFNYAISYSLTII